MKAAEIRAGAIVLALLALAGWTGALAAGFTYEPDDASAARYPEAFTAWDRAAETAFARELFAADTRFAASPIWNSAWKAPSGTFHGGTIATARWSRGAGASCA